MNFSQCQCCQHVQMPRCGAGPSQPNSNMPYWGHPHCCCQHFNPHGSFAGPSQAAPNVPDSRQASCCSPTPTEYTLGDNESLGNRTPSPQLSNFIGPNEISNADRNRAYHPYNRPDNSQERMPSHNRSIQCDSSRRNDGTNYASTSTQTKEKDYKDQSTQFNGTINDERQNNDDKEDIIIIKAEDSDSSFSSDSDESLSEPHFSREFEVKSEDSSDYDEPKKIMSLL